MVVSFVQNDYKEQNVKDLCQQIKETHEHETNVHLMAIDVSENLEKLSTVCQRHVQTAKYTTYRFIIAHQDKDYGLCTGFIIQTFRVNIFLEGQ